MTLQSQVTLKPFEKWGMEVGLIFFISASPLVSLIGNNSLCMISSMFWIGDIGSSSPMGFSKVSGYSTGGFSSSPMVIEGSSQPPEGWWLTSWRGRIFWYKFPLIISTSMRHERTCFIFSIFSLFLRTFFQIQQCWWETKDEKERKILSKNKTYLGTSMETVPKRVMSLNITTRMLRLPRLPTLIINLGFVQT